ncbi:hypothetical protein [Bradyrhizobium sp. AZCC 1693]|uniref:hypothetical protein n=1 Tax=Bradyrhizobium sp. AZCC 1693 TaxID=3117029 RepID=UPI002FF34883
MGKGASRRAHHLSAEFIANGGRAAAKAQELIERHIRETTKNVIKHAGHLFVAHDEDRRSRADHVAAE